jgi:hypothetical protein
VCISECSPNFKHCLLQNRGGQLYFTRWHDGSILKWRRAGGRREKKKQIAVKNSEIGVNYSHVLNILYRCVPKYIKWHYYDIPHSDWFSQVAETHIKRFLLLKYFDSVLWETGKRIKGLIINHISVSQRAGLNFSRAVVCYLSRSVR